MIFAAGLKKAHTTLQAKAGPPHSVSQRKCADETSSLPQSRLQFHSTDSDSLAAALPDLHGEIQRLRFGRDKQPLRACMLIFQPAGRMQALLSCSIHTTFLHIPPAYPTDDQSSLGSLVQAQRMLMLRDKPPLETTALSADSHAISLVPPASSVPSPH